MEFRRQRVSHIPVEVQQPVVNRLRRAEFDLWNIHRCQGRACNTRSRLSRLRNIHTHAHTTHTHNTHTHTQYTHTNTQYTHTQPMLCLCVRVCVLIAMKLSHAATCGHEAGAMVNRNTNQGRGDREGARTDQWTAVTRASPRPPLRCLPGPPRSTHRCAGLGSRFASQPVGWRSPQPKYCPPAPGGRRRSPHQRCGLTSSRTIMSYH